MPVTSPRLFDAIVVGGLIGLSAVFMMIFLGRIMGISSILEGSPAFKDTKAYLWRLPFILGGVQVTSTGLRII